ncbi:MAG: S8 family serine peptidase [Verrucomicrobiota bacterium]
MFWFRLFVLSSIALLLLGSARSEQLPSSSTVEFSFQENVRRKYQFQIPAPSLRATPQGSAWIQGIPDKGSPVEFGDRVVLQLRSPNELARLLERSPLKVDREVARGLIILQAPDAWTAVREADRLSKRPGVVTAHPVRRRPIKRHSAYAPKPNDPYFPRQWNLENRDGSGARLGADLNVRGAWPITRGEGIIIAIADEGVELSHPELQRRAAGAPHYNFDTSMPDGNPVFSRQIHGTAVAGLAVAEQNNKRGMSGVAPRAHFASWLVFTSSDDLVSEERVMDMFQYSSNRVAVQNHSWGAGDLQQIALGALEDVGISNAVTFGRNGLGVVIVRSAGNDRQDGKNVNDDGYAADARVIAVAAVRSTGRVASYSNPGAGLLVAAPSGDDGFANLFTTDRQGSLGYNQMATADDRSDYAFDSTGFTGTSGAAPQVAGIAALILSANPALSYRDVQQILALSARHVDLADPHIITNAAGLRFSHNVGFGIPDAGQAVRMAKEWTPRPALTKITNEVTVSMEIPDGAMKVRVEGNDLPEHLAALRGIPSSGPHADRPTRKVPLVDVGFADEEIAEDLEGKGALIERGVSFFVDKIERAARAGAEFAIIFNNTGGTDLEFMAQTEFTPIPAIFIGQTDGLNLREYVSTHPEALVHLRLDVAELAFEIPETLICEHVAVRIQTDHPLRSQVRITLESPQGTRSVLQQLNLDDSPGPMDWTYFSTLHFFESSAGIWKLHLSDEVPDNAGFVQFAGLIISGVSITDTDRDGLEDGWEMGQFGTLTFGPESDPDRDGYGNAREQMMGTNAAQAAPLLIDLSPWNERLVRLSWPGTSHQQFDLLGAGKVAETHQQLLSVPGQFPETEVFLPLNESAQRFFKVRQR